MSDEMNQNQEKQEVVNNPQKSPKKKKQKHVRLITGENGKPLRFDGTMLTNRFVRAWLRENAGCVQL